MAGAFSRHLLESCNTAKATNSPLVISGAMSFNPMMHGSMSFGSQMHFTPTPMSFANEGMSEETAMKIAALQAKLNQKLGPEFVSQRPGPRGGPKLTYAEGWKMINLANEVFGFNGWSSSVVSVTTDFVDVVEGSGRYNVGVTAIVRVTLRDGVFHEDVGYGLLENSSSKGQALDKCKKEAVTDGLKRALRNFGNLMGNCLYDKAYTQEIVKMKVPPSKFDKSELHRRPEFAEDIKPTIATSSAPKPHIPVIDSAHIRTSESLSTARSNTKRSGQAPPNLRSSSATDVGVNLNLSNSRSSGPSVQRMLHKPQENRQVSFVDPSTRSNQTNGSISEHTKSIQPKTEVDEHFDFGEDDSFFATVDMGESDLGRPIETEADVGPPIDQEDSTELSLALGKDTRSASVESAEASERKGSSDNRNNKASRLLKLQQEITEARNSVANTNLFPEIALASDIDPTNLRPSHKIQHQTEQTRQGQVGHPRQNQDPRTFAKPSPRIQNENVNPSTPSSSGEGKRSSTSSMGGFHFPPGVDPPALLSRPLMPSNSNASVGHSQTNTPVNVTHAGIKRSAEAMTTGCMNKNQSTSYRGSRPGMGLQQNVPLRREPFAQLDIDEGGDVKRIKR